MPSTYFEVSGRESHLDLRIDVRCDLLLCFFLACALCRLGFRSVGGRGRQAGQRGGAARQASRPHSPCSGLSRERTADLLAALLERLTG